MKSRIVSTFILLILTVSLAACSDTKNTGVSIETVEPVEFQDYHMTLIGSNSDVSAILSKLPGNTMQKEYSVADENLSVLYDTEKLDSQIDDDWYNNETGVKEVFLHNALYIAALIDNVDLLSFSLVNGETDYTWALSKSELEEFLGTDLSVKIQDNQAWNSYVKERLKTENLRNAFEEFSLEAQ